MIKPICLLILAGMLGAPLNAQTSGGNANNNRNNGNQTQAQQPQTTDTVRKDKLWSASLGNGSYLVRLNAIQSISRHQYVLDGAVIVDEVTVDALGQALARFYFIKPITEELGGSATATAAGNIARRGRELVDNATGRAGVSPQDMVVKKYPETTHARTIEFRVFSDAELSALYKSVRTAWTGGRGRTFTAN